MTRIGPKIEPITSPKTPSGCATCYAATYKHFKHTTWWFNCMWLLNDSASATWQQSVNIIILWEIFTGREKNLGTVGKKITKNDIIHENKINIIFLLQLKGLTTDDCPPIVKFRVVCIIMYCMYNVALILWS